MLIMVLVSLLFIVLGILIKNFRWYWLISGYNTMPREKKKNVDTEGLGALIGNSMFVIAGIMLLGGLLNHMGYWWGIMTTLFLMMLCFIYILVAAQKYDHNQRTTKDRVIIMVVIAALIVVLGGASAMIYSGSRPTRVEVTSGYVRIEGLYGITIPTERIETVSLEKSMPEVLAKTNGFNAGDALKGSFRLEEIGSAKLFVQSHTGPFIYIVTTQGETVIINYSEEDKTRELHAILLAAAGR